MSQAASARRHGPDGWRRAVLGIMAGAVLGTWLARCIPGERRWRGA